MMSAHMFGYYFIQTLCATHCERERNQASGVWKKGAQDNSRWNWIY
jgi:hypothetical protein